MQTPHAIILSATLGILLAFLSFLTGKAKYTCPLNPIFVFGTSYALVQFTYVTLSLHKELDPISNNTLLFLVYQFLVFLAFLTFTSPNLSGNHFRYSIRKSEEKASINKVALQVLIFSGILSMIVFGLYLLTNNILSGNVILNLNKQRLDMANGIKPKFFYWFYIAEVFPPLCYLAFTQFKTSSIQKFICFALSAACTLSLLFTAAKVNFIKPVKFVLIILLLQIWLKSRTKKISISRYVKIGVCFLIPPLALIGYMLALGEYKTFAESATDVGYRFSAQVPTLEKVLSEDSPEYNGKLTLLPISKLLAAFGLIDSSPNHILPFYHVPFSWNVATYLDVGYRDFGLWGILLIPIYFSLVVSSLLWASKYSSTSIGKIGLFILACNFFFISISVAPFIKPIYWFQIVLFVFFDYLFKKHYNNFTVRQEPTL